MLPLPNTPIKEKPDANLRVTHKSDKKHPLIDGNFINDLIEIKQKRKLRDKLLQPLFFSIGIFISLSLIVLAFEWKTYDNPEVIDLNSSAIITEETIDIPPTQQAPPPPPQALQQPNFVEVPEEEIIEEIEVNFDVEMTEQTVIPTSDIDIVTEEIEEEVADEIFSIVEEKPSPAGGLKEFMEYLHSNIRYPKAALRLGIEGKVFAQFVVDKDGSLTQVEVIRGIGGGCDEEAIRVIKASPNWNPGKQRGLPVKVRMVLPVNFVLNEKR